MTAKKDSNSCDGNGMRMLFVVCLVAAALLIGYTVGGGKMGGGMSKDALHAEIAQYLKDNPQALVDSLNSYQQKQEEDRYANVSDTIKKLHDEIFEDAASPVAGNPKGDVTVVEFFDYHCGYCKRSLPNIVKLIEDDKNVRVVFKEFPILSPNSTLAAKVALSVFKVNPDKYFEFHSYLMKSSGSPSEDELLKKAEEMGLDKQKVKDGMADAEKELTKNRELASQLNIRGTPAFIIGDTLIPGAVDVDTMKKQIEVVRSGKK